MRNKNLIISIFSIFILFERLLNILLCGHITFLTTCSWCLVRTNNGFMVKVIHNYAKIKTDIDASNDGTDVDITTTRIIRRQNECFRPVEYSFTVLSILFIFDKRFSHGYWIDNLIPRG